MERLLHWAVENSDAKGLEESRKNMKNLDPEIIDMILGKDDPTRMKDCIVIIRDKSGKYNEDERLNAFDELEMIVEGIDNASNMDRMNLWPEIFACITEEESVSVVKFALWIIGTCAQNNPETQAVLVGKHSIFSRLLDLWKQPQINPEDSITIHSKILYCLTCILSNNPVGLKEFESLRGFEVLEGFQESSEALRGKLSFLLCTVLGNEIGFEAVNDLLGETCPKLSVILKEGPSDNI